MTVFKGYMKIIRRNAGMILMYVAIFTGITILFQIFDGADSVTSYQAESLRVAVVDEDGGVLAAGLGEYLGQFHDVVWMENDRARLQEELFYRNVEYIVRIPEHFFEKCIKGGEKLAVTKVPGSYTAFYVDQQVNSFLNDARVCHAAGFSQEETAETLKGLEPAQVELLDASGRAGKMPAYGFYFRYIPYLFLSVLCYVIGNVLMVFQKGDLPKRMRASAVSGRRQSLEGLLAVAVLGIGLWVFCMFLAFLFYGKNLMKSFGLPYHLLNTLLLLFVTLTLSYLIGTLIPGGKDAINTLNGIVNVLSLGMCFLCGVFVPLELLNQKVRTVAQFLPVYWYETVNELLLEYGSITGEVKEAVLRGLGMQFAFIAALVCLTMSAAKWRRV